MITTEYITTYKCGLCGKEEKFYGIDEERKADDIWGKFEIGKIRNDHFSSFMLSLVREYKIEICPECAEKFFKYSVQKETYEEVKNAWQWFKERLGIKE
jgi:hypothetical protein